MIDALQTIIMHHAFEMVENPDHWKGPINATVEVPEVTDGAIIKAAIEYFTATQAVVKLEGRTAKGYKLNFKAAGYWAGPAA